MSVFKITEGKGFQMTFQNGWTVSVQFGAGNYCENNMMSVSNTPKGHSKDAEIAAWDKDGNWHTFEYDDVKGYCSADEAADFITKIKSL